MVSGPEPASPKWERPSIVMTNIEKVELGMTYGEVAGIMGKKIDIGYTESSASNGKYEEILVKNPYYEEVLTDRSGARYRVVYYFTHIKKADGIVSDDELTPLVFEENRLIGKGRGFLFELKDRVK